jgi:hypothetical protein
MVKATAAGSEDCWFEWPRGLYVGEPLWLSGKVVNNEKINEIERTRVRFPPRATSLKKRPICIRFSVLLCVGNLMCIFEIIFGKLNQFIT